MNLFSKLVAGWVISFSVSAHADSLVACSDAKVVNGPTILSYVISGTASARLMSPINVSGTTYSQAEVAQYKTTKNELYVLIDDAVGAPVAQFAAILPCQNRLVFQGVLKASSNGITSLKYLKCQLIAL